jgi:hypothetical protein
LEHLKSVLLLSALALLTNIRLGWKRRKLGIYQVRSGIEMKINLGRVGEALVADIATEHLGGSGVDHAQNVLLRFGVDRELKPLI